MNRMDFDNHSNGLSSNNHGMSFNNGNGKSSSSTYQNVIHKKQSGTLILTEDGYTFYPIGGGGGSQNGGGTATATGANGGNGSVKQPMKQSWLHVAKHQVSPASHARHLLKIVLQVKPDNSSASSAVTQSNQATGQGTKAKANSAMFELKTKMRMFSLQI